MEKIVKKFRGVKLNGRIRATLYEYSSLGYTNKDIAVLLDVHPVTISNWRKVNPDIKRNMDKLRKECLRSTVVQGLIEAAKGATSTRTVKTYSRKEIDKDTGEEIDTIYRQEKTILAPNIKAIQILARRCEKEFSDIPKLESDLVSNIAIGINTAMSSMRELQEYNDANNPLDAVIEAEGAVVTIEDMGSASD